MIIIGHRGARGLAPENTIAALEKGYQHGVTELEFDLRITKDQLVVLHHDPFMTTPDGSRLTIADHTFQQLHAHKADLATFEQVLDRFGNVLPLYIEVKPHVNLKPIIALLKVRLAAGLAAEQLRLASFSQPILRELHAAFPTITTIVIEKWSGVRATYRARSLGTQRIAMNQRWLWWGFVRAMARGGYQLTPYTVNNPRQAAAWCRHGLYGVVTDYPDRFNHQPSNHHKEAV